MPASYEVEDETGIVVVTIAGVITLDEWQAHVDRILADPAAKRPLRVLSDNRRRESLPSAGEIRSIIKLAAELAKRPGHRMAIVVSRPVQYGIGRMAQVFFEMARVFEARVFKDIDKAREWLLSEEEKP